MEENKETEVVNENNVNVAKKNNVCGIISLVFSLIGILVAGLPCGLVAIITGIIGIAGFKPETEKGKGMAISGLIIGALDVVIVLVYAILKVAAIMPL